ncbi:MAG: glycoside hydrolase family 3 C-terminal domain-containing protein [Anaerotruncus sp.]|nr:glycoside hydrolase family 3 C-terminal domain-containing protein [Anaerotruncus sp.]
MFAAYPAKNPRTNGGGSSELMPYKIEIPLEAIQQRAAVQYFPDYQITPELAKAVQSAAKVLVFTGTTPEIESEGFDAPNHCFLPAEQVTFLRDLTALHQGVIVVNSGSSAVDIRSFEPAIAGFVQTWFLGSASGEALAHSIWRNIALPAGSRKHSHMHRTYADLSGVSE